MRKRSKYRPKGVIMDTMAWLKSGWMKLADTHEANMNVRLRNHMALDMLRSGKATNTEVSELINAMNVAEALSSIGIGADYKEEIQQAQQALVSLINRQRTYQRFVLTAVELSVLNLGMEIHDAQLDAATISDIEKALKIERQNIQSGKAVHV